MAFDLGAPPSPTCPPAGPRGRLLGVYGRGGHTGSVPRKKYRSEPGLSGGRSDLADDALKAFDATR